ncbi:hypothetical protein JQC92_02300 [Shewanella sp. 202IG2-18]|uniref:hypothetical protein n=1 Tax=Parashewanella hymeniacidonis TaxID=2807618 RepID=UPI00195F6C49|nr:hypothetical protein [Parashewanella hymeniacidonis]MBM7070872.1 hypothetical protein [Parashewanella hymeniacidonis]
MPVISVNAFSGERPRLDPRHLPNEAAQASRNCHFYYGNLSPLKQPEVLPETIPSSIQTIFQYEKEHWFTWYGYVDAVVSPVANDPWQRVYFTGDGFPRVTNNQIFNGSVKPANSYRLGVPAPESIITAVVNEDATEEVDPNDDETRYYTYTYVTEAGEEGAPAQASDRVLIRYPEEEGTYVTLNIPGINVNDANITHIRIYRSLTGGGIADYLLVAEVPISTTIYDDRAKGDELGSPLETYDYERPNENMKGLTSMSNGIMAGFFDNTLCFSKSYLPYAWPSGYQHTTDHDIVALVSSGNSLTVLTEGRPWLFSGASPESISGRNLELNQACVSKRSAIVVNGAVMYASPDGLVALSGNGAQVITEGILTREQWQAFEPSTIRAFEQERRYLGFYGEGLDKCFIFDPQTGDFRHFDFRAVCGFNSLIDDSLYLAQSGKIYKWESSENLFPLFWQSKEYRFNHASFSCALVRGDIANIGFRLYADRKLVIEKPVGSIPDSAFRLPTVRGKYWHFELFGTGEVETVVIASSMSELQEVING